MLNDITIEQCVDHQDLILPYTEKQLNPNSYDVTLQDTIITFAKVMKDCYADAATTRCTASTQNRSESTDTTCSSRDSSS